MTVHVDESPSAVSYSGEYDPTNGISLNELIRLVRLRLGDMPKKVRKTGDTGDGVVTDYFLADHVYEHEGASVAEVATSGYTLDYDSGWLSFYAAPTGALVFKFSTVTFTNERITEAINSAIDELFGKFYVHGMNDDLWSDGTAEFVVQTSAGVDLDPEDRITKVEYHNGSRWVRTDHWKVSRNETSKIIVFEFTPITGANFRVHYASMPTNLVNAYDTLETTAGLPARAKEPLVLFACADLITDRIHNRIRDDRAHNTQGENVVKSYEIQNDAQFLRAQAELKASKLRMSPLMSRVAY